MTLVMMTLIHHLHHHLVLILMLILMLIRIRILMRCVGMIWIQVWVRVVGGGRRCRILPAPHDELLVHLQGYPSIARIDRTGVHLRIQIDLERSRIHADSRPWQPSDRPR